MKKLLLAITAILLFAGISPASAANWTEEVQAAIKSGNFDQINVIAAKNPSATGDIAVYLLEQSQNSNFNLSTRIKLFEAALPLGGQIALSDSGEVAKIVNAWLDTANDPTFQKGHPHDASTIFAVVLGLSNQPNLLTTDPNLHELALADAGDFTSDNNPDPKLKEEVDLALQVGLPPPLGPRGIINPSGE